MRIARFRWRWGRPRQRVFSFLDRRLRRERQFKRAIVAVTAMAIIGIFLAFPWGHYLSASIDSWAGRTFRRSLWVFQSRADINESWRDFRRASIERTRVNVERAFTANDPALQRLLQYAGMDPEHGVLGWGNYDWTLLLSSKVFEPDDRLSYRLRAGVRSIWLRDVFARIGGAAFFLVPDGPGLAEAIRGTTAHPVEGSRQSTNSWGLRGPEPDPEATVRVLVLGDSFMQGMFIGDEETPPECLRRRLRAELKTDVCVLNAGLMGYSPEQYYYSLVAFKERFRPHLVVVSVFANDCGDTFDAVGRGEGDWLEGKYWLEMIVRDCQAEGRPCLIVPAPFEPNLMGKRKPGFYPGRLANLLNIESRAYLDPSDDFLNAHLKARVEARRDGRTLRGCVLFNDRIDDNHFSPAGAEVWADSVGRRLILLLEDRHPPADGRLSGRDRERSRVGWK